MPNFRHFISDLLVEVPKKVHYLSAFPFDWFLIESLSVEEVESWVVKMPQVMEEKAKHIWEIAWVFE